MLKKIYKWGLGWPGLSVLISVLLVFLIVRGFNVEVFFSTLIVGIVFFTIGYVAVSVNEKISIGELAIRKEIDAIRRQSENHFNQFKQSIEQKPYQHFRRILSNDDENKIIEKWLPLLDLNMTGRQLRYLQHRISFIEDQALGRFAGHVQDAILRVLVGLGLKKEKINILEIGTLFGVNAIILYEILSVNNIDVELTLIDPLEGFYGKDNRDWGTGLPVSRSILEKNLRKAMVPSESVNIIQEYSTNENAIKEASMKKYDYIFIDGDHTFDGVKKDFELYAPFCEEGGVLVFDDYHNERWPDVTKFVDEIVMKSDEFELVGDDWETVAFRKRNK